MYLTEEDIEMLDGSILVMANMYMALRSCKTAQAGVSVKDFPKDMRRIYEKKGKSDTKYFDALSEIAISLGLEGNAGHDTLFLRIYSEPGVVITDERGKVGQGSNGRIEQNTPVIVTDPTDRSKFLESIIAAHRDTCSTVGEVFDKAKKELGEDRARVEGCNSSITLLKDNMIKYAVILNLLTGEVFVAYERGVYHGDIGVYQGNIAQIKSTQDLTSQNKASFKDNEDLEIIYFCQGEEYEHNRDGTHLRLFKPVSSEPKSPGGPGGPIRFTYLLKGNSVEDIDRIGVIAHNGEKLQESLPNVAVAFFSNGVLWAYKLFCDREYTAHRSGKLLTPNIQNSLYDLGLLANTGLNLTFLNNHERPSEFRETTVIAPATNDAAITMLEGMVKRHYAVRII